MQVQRGTYLHTVSPTGGRGGGGRLQLLKVFFDSLANCEVVKYFRGEARALGPLGPQAPTPETKWTLPGTRKQEVRQCSGQI